jgi:glycosyltransferase involved in cell wall biosynthesis
VGPARNTGIRAGKAEWIAFVDADDVWNADHLAELDELRRAFPKAGLIGCAFRRFSGDVAQNSLSKGAPVRRLARYFAECARGTELLVTSSAAARRSAIDQVGDFEDLPGNEDVELWARLALHAPVAVSSLRTVNYRVDTGGITDKGMGDRKPRAKPTRREQFSSTIPTLERALPSIADPGLRSDLVAYMDSRIGIRLTAAVLDGDIDYARQLLPLFEGEPKGQARTAARIAKLPRPLAKAIVGTRRWIKRQLASR